MRRSPATPRADRSASTKLDDAEFGPITIKRNAKAKRVSLRMLANGEIVVTLPRRAAMSNSLRIIEESRDQIRKWRAKHQQNRQIFRHGDTVGKSHTIKISYLPESSPVASVRIRQSEICLYLPINQPLESLETQKLLVPAVKKALTKDAKAHLPQRLSQLASQHGFSYEKIRFGTPQGRWGSCSSTCTISLNVSLIMLEDTLIDYVLVHELCHTRQMNHSTAFWSLVEKCLPDYKTHRTELKKRQPI